MVKTISKMRKQKDDTPANLSESLKACDGSNEETKSSEDHLSFLNGSPLKKEKNEFVQNLEDSDEDKILIKKAMELVKPTRKPYNSKQLNELDYEKIADAFDDKTADECRIRLQALVNRTIKTKCLYQILNETAEEVDERRKKANKFSLFIMLNKDKISEAMKQGKGSNQMAVAATMWKELTDGEKEFYYNNLPKNRENPAPRGKTPFDIYLAGLKKEDENVSTADARVKWTDLNIENKVEFIEQSMEIMKDIQNRDHKAKATDGGEAVAKLKGPSKSEWISFFRYLGAPEMPPKLAALMYYKKTFADGSENPTATNFLFDALKSFKELSHEEQRKWEDSFKEAWQVYRAKLVIWRKSQDDAVNSFYRITMEQSGKNSTRKTKVACDLSKREIHKNLKRIKMSRMKFKKFQNEPSIPPVTAFQLFSRELERNSIEELSNLIIKERFLALGKKERSVLIETASKLRETFTTDLKFFVDAMSEEQRKLYLGRKRVRFINLLADDIFAKDYPDTEYPVYIIPKQKVVLQKRPKTKKMKFEVVSEDDDENSSVELDRDDEKVETSKTLGQSSTPQLSKCKYSSGRIYNSDEELEKLSSSESDEEGLEDWINSSVISKRVLVSEDENSD